MVKTDKEGKKHSERDINIPPSEPLHAKIKAKESRAAIWYQTAHCVCVNLMSVDQNKTATLDFKLCLIYRRVNDLPLNVAVSLSNRQSAGFI